MRWYFWIMLLGFAMFIPTIIEAPNDRCIDLFDCPLDEISPPIGWFYHQQPNCRGCGTGTDCCIVTYYPTYLAIGIALIAMFIGVWFWIINDENKTKSKEENPLVDKL